VSVIPLAQRRYMVLTKVHIEQSRGSSSKYLCGIRFSIITRTFICLQQHAKELV
jgi:hypothetical protein